MLWAMWDHFQGGSLCLTSSVCWFFRLTSSVALWGGGMLQTNSTVVCTQYLSPAWPVLSHGTQTALALWCSAGNRLGPALGCVHFPGPSRSGSALRQPSEAQIRLELRFVPFPGPSSSAVTKNSFESVLMRWMKPSRSLKSSIYQLWESWDLKLLAMVSPTLTHCLVGK